MIDLPLLVVPAVLVVITLVLSFSGCSLVVARDRPYGSVLIAFHKPTTVTGPIARVVFIVRRPGPTILREAVLVLQDRDRLILDDQIGTVESFSDSAFHAANQDTGEFRYGGSDIYTGPLGLRWQVLCRAYPHKTADNDPYVEAEQILNPGPDDVDDLATPLEFHFTIRDADPRQVIALPTGQQTILKQPDVLMQFTRPSTMKMQRVMKVAFKITVTVSDGTTFDVVETIADLESHATHVENALWTTFPSKTWDESGSNDTGAYRMSILNAPAGRWTVTCEAFDSKTSTDATYPPDPDPVAGGTIELDVGTVEPPTSHQVPFKFKLERTAGSGLGFVVKRDKSP